MDIRYSANQRDVKRYTTEELRKEFLIQNLYQADEVVAVYSHVDRMVTMGCMPVSEKVSIEKGQAGHRRPDSPGGAHRQGRRSGQGAHRSRRWFRNDGDKGVYLLRR